MYKFLKKILPFMVVIFFVFDLSTVMAAPPDDVTLNAGGGGNASDGLRIHIHRGSQIQIIKPNSNGSVRGQLFEDSRIPTTSADRNRLDNGIYIRANNRLYGPSHFVFARNGVSNPNAYTTTGDLSVTPATASSGQAQQTTSKFTLPNTSIVSGNPEVTVVWKYTYPLSFVTAEVTLTVPLLYPVSSSNPVRYYHAVDTFLGGSDNGCGIRYVDTNGRQVVGTYPVINGGCPSSTTLPNNLDIVESFRERSGKFSNYCVGRWDTFWTYDTTPETSCAIGKARALSNTISTTNIDTGAAIEYDFTSPGTYTFSYDFVIGSTYVPSYDHLEIRHPGTNSLCPVDIQVLACLSSTVPCPTGQILSAGSLTGNLTVSPTTPTVNSPNSSFEVGGNAQIDTVTLQGSAAATYTLGASDLARAPLNGVKCVNTTTNAQSCSFTFTNTPCIDKFECMESGLAYNNRVTNPTARNPLYTKVIGTGFDVDAVAVLTNGNQSTAYSANGVVVDLVNDNGGSCGQTVVATKTINFAVTDAGRKKVTFTNSDVLSSYPNLRCRVRDLNLIKTGCSSDNFAIRPLSLSVTNVVPQQLTPSYTSAPVRRAGTDKFSVTVSANEATYTGTPKVDSSKLLTHNNETSVGLVNGLFNPAIAGISTGSNFTYSEVGHFKFKAEGIYDDTYAEVDITNGDCDNSFDSQGTGTPKRFGCKFGNTVASDYIGRFIPDHFKITAGTTYTDGCGSFTYYDQDPGLITPFVLEAKNAADVTTQYYAGSYAIFALNNWTNYLFELASVDGTLIPNGVTIAASTVNPSGSWSAGIANVQARHRITRPANAVAPRSYKISAKPRGDDGGVMVDSTRTDIFNPTDPNTPQPRFRLGRLVVTSAHGSELLPLSVPIEAQFWNGTGFVRNRDDSCTAIPLTSIVMRNYRGNLNACETQLSIASPMSNGVLGLRLSAPGVTGTTPNTGSVDLEVNLGAAGAGERTCTSATETQATNGSINWFGNPDPIGRATFGVYKAPIIYMRENF
jgi:MSHA biogenesis protein MshQ